MATYHPSRKTIKVRITRHTGHCWRRGDEHISDVLLWTPSHERAKAGRPAGTDKQQLYAIQNIALKTGLERWTIKTGGIIGSGRSVLAVRHDANDDNQRYHIHAKNQNNTLATLVKGDPKALFFNSYQTEELGRALFYSLVCFTLSLILTL